MSTLEVHNHTILGPLHCFDPKPPKGYTNFFDSVVIRCNPSPPPPPPSDQAAQNGEVHAVRPPGPQINTPTWVLYVSWYAKSEFRMACTERSRRSIESLCTTLRF